MGNAVHKVLIELVSDGLPLLCSVVRSNDDLRSVTLGSQGAVDQGTCGLDGQSLGHADRHLGLTGKTLCLNVLVGGDHDGASTGDLCGGKLVFDSNLAVGLNLDGEPALSRSLLQRFLCHKGMRDAGRTTGCRDNVILLSNTSLLLSRSERPPLLGAASSIIRKTCNAHSSRIFSENHSTCVHGCFTARYRTG